jgi:hypothetical protein
MYTGNLIDDLIAVVERAETSFRPEPEPDSNLAFLYAVQSDLLDVNGAHQLAGVA